MYRTREENAEDLRLEVEPNIQGVCKDCGNGTLNNNLAPAFSMNGDEDFAGGDTVACLCCGSTHVDCIVF